MFGVGFMSSEMLDEWAKRSAEQRRRADAYQATGMSISEAYLRATCDMESEAWAAVEKAKLDDIRENGT